MPQRFLHRVSNPLLLGVLAATVFAFSAGGQQSVASLGRLTTFVVDATGAAWVRADVVLIDTRTLQEQRGIADEKGVARFPSLKPGNYVLIAAPHPPIG